MEAKRAPKEDGSTNKHLQEIPPIYLEYLVILINKIISSASIQMHGKMTSVDDPSEREELNYPRKLHIDQFPQNDCLTDGVDYLGQIAKEILEPTIYNSAFSSNSSRSCKRLD